MEERAPWAPFPELNELVAMLIREREHVALSDLITPRLFPAGPIPCYSTNRRKLSGSTVLPCCRASCRKLYPVPQFHEVFREKTSTNLEKGLGSNLIELFPSPSPIEFVSEGKVVLLWCELSKVESGSTVTRFISERLRNRTSGGPFPAYSVSPDCIDPDVLRNKLSKPRAQILKLNPKP